MNNNLITYAGTTAQINFNAQSMSMVGTIDDALGTIQFSASTVSSLVSQYENLSRVINQRELSVQPAEPNLDLQTGEATIRLDPNWSREKLGAIIKQVLILAEGASVFIKESTQFNKQLSEVNKHD